MDTKELKEQLKKEQLEIQSRLKVLDLFPDLRQTTDRWSHKYFCTSKVNSIVDSADIRHNCGCCEDSPLEIRPYKKIEGIEIYSDPPCFTVGEKIPFYAGTGEREYDGWEDEMRKENISETIIQMTREHFNANKPKHIEYVDDE